MSEEKRSSLQEVVREQFQKRQAREELRSSLLFIVVVFAVFVVIAFFSIQTPRELQAYGVIRVVFLGMALSLLAVAAVIWRGLWHPALRYVNVILQVTALSVILVLVGQERGPGFALSTALPMLYCFVISITAFRLSPALSLTAGGLAGLQFLAVYAWFLRPLIGEDVLAQNATLAWPAMAARIIILLAIGGACALAAQGLREQFRKNAEDQKRIQMLERTFGRLVAPEVARRILEDENWMKPARRDAVVMFADLKGFTKFAEGHPAEYVAGFLNRCWSVAADIVEKHGGVINKYMGDGFLALFGVPMELGDAEKAAAETAADLQQSLASLLEPEGLELCVGVHAGPLIVGGIGSESRCEFTVIGSTVNLASRVESLNRTLATRCLTTKPVAEKIGEQWEMREKGEHRVKGVSEEVKVFELLRKAESGESDGV